MIIALALRVLEGWFMLGVALGLCWTAACFTVRRARDMLVAIVAKLDLASRVHGALLLPPPGCESAAQGELFCFSFGLALPTHADAARAALARVRVHSQA